jgi:hypothetical protein
LKKEKERAIRKRKQQESKDWKERMKGQADSDSDENTQKGGNPLLKMMKKE